MEGVAAPSVVDEKIYLIILFFKLPSDPLQIFFKVTYCDFEAGHFFTFSFSALRMLFALSRSLMARTSAGGKSRKDEISSKTIVAHGD